MGEALRVEGLRKSFGERHSLRGIDLRVEAGDMFGYLGSNGAGKTTTIRVLLDLVKPDSGEVRIMGERADRPEVRRRVGFVLDSDGLYDSMTAAENLEFHARLYGIRNPGPRVAARLEEAGLADRAKDRVRGFSKGMRQRLALARALVHDPELLILDEPMSGIDPSGRIELRGILRRLLDRGNTTVFLSSHDLDEVQRTCNRVALIDRGEIRLAGELRSLMRAKGGDGIEIEIGGELPGAVARELEGLPGLGYAGMREGRLAFSPESGTRVSDLVALLAARGVAVEGARRREASLEELYASILAEREGGTCVSA